MTPKDLDRTLAERLLAVMDQKHHWGYPYLTRPGLTRAQHFEHFKHEYLVYVRDFPVLLARCLGNVPDVIDVRRSLAENIYEEQCGGISETAPHPELFLRMMEGMGYRREQFAEDDAWLHPSARAYRDLLRETSANARHWQTAVALLTIFVEGSVNERAELAGTYVRSHGEDAILKHPLVAHYGCPPSAMALTRAHAKVEGAHRSDAWKMILDHVGDDGPSADDVVATLVRTLAAWHRYRDGVAERMHLSRDGKAA